MAIRTRYAPSPTGDPHLGNLQVAVFDYLQAKGGEGQFLVRVEDTDQARSVPGSLERILASLQWLGLEADEGAYLAADGTVQEKGDYGPYTQSKRLPIYQEHAQLLVASGHAYHCFCSPERLTEVRAAQQAAHQPPKYDRHCRDLATDEVAKRLAAGEPSVIRQKVPDGEEVVLFDAVRDEVRFQSSELDDSVLLKSDGYPTYHLANVVDDHLMEISHVFRGEEWLPSAPKHLLLYKAFGWEPPRYAHMPLILGPDRSKLSKRHGAEPVLTYRDRGYLPDAVLNVLALLGWSPGTEEEFFARDELIRRFLLERVQKTPAIFDVAKLDFVNGWYIRRLTLSEMVERMLPFWVADGLLVTGEASAPLHLVVNSAAYVPSTNEVIVAQPTYAEFLMAAARLVQERMKRFDEAAALTWYFFKRPTVDDVLRALVVPKKGDPAKTAAVLQEVITLLATLAPERWTAEGLDEALRVFIAEKGYSNAEVLWPIRAALSGEQASPGTFDLLAVFGRDESLARLQAVAG